MAKILKQGRIDISIGLVKTDTGIEVSCEMSGDVASDDTTNPLTQRRTHRIDLSATQEATFKNFVKNTAIVQFKEKEQDITD